MKVRRVRLRPLSLVLRSPLDTAFGRLHRRPGWLLCLEGEGGVPGLGEATPLAAFGTETTEACGAALDALRLEGVDAEDPAAREQALAGLARTPVARAAAECALLDLAARARGESLAVFLSGGSAPVARWLPLSALIRARAPQAVAAEVAEAVDGGFVAVKLKLSRDPEADRERLVAARRAGGATLALRGDANGAWSPDEAAERLAALAPLDLDYVEQPVPAGAVEALAALRRRGAVPVAADESAATPAGLARVLELGAADVVILKPSLLGPGTALSLATRARAAGLRSVVTSLLDGAVAHHAAAAVAAAMGARAGPEGPQACGLGTAGGMQGDPCPAPRLRRGRLELSAAPGLGVAPPGGLAA